MNNDKNIRIHKIYHDVKYNKKVECVAFKKNLHSREKIIVYISISLSIALISRLFYISEYKRDFLEKIQANNTVRNIITTIPRGSIFDRFGVGLALSTPVYSIYLNISEFNDEDKQKLKSLLLQAKIKNDVDSLDKNTYLLRNATPDKAEIFKKNHIDGIYVYETFKRYYPIKDSGNNLIGRTNVDDIGIDGLEFKYNYALKSHNGVDRIVKSLDGQVIDSSTPEPTEKGVDLKLTIDANTQVAAYDYLKQQISITNAKGGSAIVLNAKTGEILAMVSYPSVNPNIPIPKNYKKSPDPTYQTVFDPGSIMKPLVIAKAIDDKKVTPNTTINTSPFKVGIKVIKDDHPMPNLTVSKVIQYSSDIGTAKIALMYNTEVLYNYYKDLGFGVKSGLGLSGETKGILQNYKHWTQMDQALMSFGYGISINLLQIARSYTIFTNNGCLLKPKLLIDKEQKKDDCIQLVSPQTAMTMRNILESTVVDGTGKSAKSNEFSVAGKTGTAQKLVNGHYANNAHVSSFVGFAPVESPKYIVAVMIDEPKNGYYAAKTAAPLFSRIMTYVMSK